MREFHPSAVGCLLLREPGACTQVGDAPPDPDEVPAVSVAEFVGTERLLDRLRDVGFFGLAESASYYGPALILGTAEVSVWEAAEAYTCLARAGECISLTWSRDEHGRPHRAFMQPAAELVAENLSNPAWRVRFLQMGMAPTRFEVPVATKTGTSEHHVDTWAIAFNSSFVIVVWAGNADGTPTRGLTGTTGAGPIAVELVRLILAERKNAARPESDWPTSSLEALEVCVFSGLLATEACPETVERLFDPDRMPEASCALHRRGTGPAARRASASRFVCTHDGPERAVVLPPEYGQWLDEHRHRSENPDVHVDAYGYHWYLATESKDCEIFDQLSSSAAFPKQHPVAAPPKR